MRIFIILTLVLIVTFGITGCKSGSKQKLRIMPLGDSITYDDAHSYFDASGNNLVSAGERTAYRSFLAYNLDGAGVKYDFVGSRHSGFDVEPSFDPDNEGHPGWTSKQIASHVYRFLAKNPADIVLLHIGTNDHSKSIKGVKKIIREIRRYEKDHNANIKIFVALIINRWFHDYKIEGFNKKLEAYLDSKGGQGITKVDMRHLLSGRAGDYLENTHPSKSGYEKMADRWFSEIIDYVR